MSRSRGSAVVLLVLASLAAGGCATGLVQRDQVVASTRIAVVSVVMPRSEAGPKDAGQAVLQSAVDHAAEQVRSRLAGVHSWTVEVPQQLSSFGSPEDTDLAGPFPQAGERARAAGLVLAERADWNSRFIAAKGMPVIPREALAPDEERSQKDPAVRAVLLQQAGGFCRRLKADAAAFVHLRYVISHPRQSTFIVADGRTDGMLRLSATLVIVDSTGRIIADLGVRPVDDRSRSRDLLPLYRGAGKAAVQPGNIDLADPKKKVAQAFTALVDEAVADLTDAFAKELAR